METYECQKTWEKTFSTEWPSHSAAKYLARESMLGWRKTKYQHNIPYEMLLPSRPRGTSTNQHEQAWTMKLVSISHVFSITCIACCNILWHTLIFYKLNDFSVTLYLQNDSQRNVTTKWLTTRKVKHLDENNFSCEKYFPQVNHQTARPLAWVDFGGISLVKGPPLTSCKPLISGTCPSGRMKQPLWIHSATKPTRHGVLKNQAWQLPLRLLKGLKGMKLLTQWPVLFRRHAGMFKRIFVTPTPC